MGGAPAGLGSAHPAVSRMSPLAPANTRRLSDSVAAHGPGRLVAQRSGALRGTPGAGTVGQ
jgi:hypothetical protein